jgi:hypothetical protein
MGKTRSTLITLFAGMLAGLALAVVAAWSLGLTSRAPVQVVEGLAWVEEGGTSIGLSPDGERPGPAYFVAGALWREQDGAWHDTFPTCLMPLTLNQHVRLGILPATGQGAALDRPVVVWLECLD